MLIHSSKRSEREGMVAVFPLGVEFWLRPNRSVCAIEVVAKSLLSKQAALHGDLPRKVELLRLALNDVQSTELLAGAAVDRQTGATFVNVEASRRFGSRMTLDVEYRAFVGIPPEDIFLYGIRNDDYLQATWAFHF